jgi:FkbM family methyltransferase
MDKDIAGTFSLLNSLNEALLRVWEDADIAALASPQGDTRDTIIQAIDAVTDRCREYALLVGSGQEAYPLPDNGRLTEAVDQLKNGGATLDSFMRLYDSWFDASLRLLTAYKTNRYDFGKSGLRMDRDFCSLVGVIRRNSLEQLCNHAMENLRTIRNENPELYKTLTVEYRGWYFPGNWLDGVDGENNSLIVNRMKVLKNSLHKFEWLYEKLADYRSRETLLAVILNWLTFSMEGCKRVADYSGRLCCDPDIFRFCENEVFVDAGAYVGDTIAEFVSICDNNYKRVYAYDISSETIDCLRKNVETLKNVVIHWKGVSDKKGQLSLSGVAAPFHGNRLVEERGIYNVEVVTIDEDIAETITFLKVDVEGLDKEALMGARNHIVNDHPKIVVDAYHKLEDIVEIPLLIQRLNPDYRFYLRLPASDIQFAVGHTFFFA